MQSINVHGAAYVPTGDITIKCDWQNSFVKSGAVGNLNSIIGNAMGVIFSNWPTVVAVFAIIAIVTFGLSLRSKKAVALRFVAVIAVAIAGVSLFSGVSAFGTSPCNG